ncbi:Beta-1,3-galactosyltransferase 7 [Acorus gramineus]|uniref:Hexosyltransferase n=1 Tax=Acorus gramineus TaxID=55184 RepID=A0AAV9APD1_ACOGR|nr:Beta-1,3-galactosyltransferase 7 [Acorus gramineus]
MGCGETTLKTAKTFRVSPNNPDTFATTSPRCLLSLSASLVFGSSRISETTLQAESRRNRSPPPPSRCLLNRSSDHGISPFQPFIFGQINCATSNSILDRAIDSEDSQHNDFLRLDHVEGYHELSAKTKTFFSTAVAKWDAEFYVKVDDDVHVNLGMLAATLSRHRSKPRIYIGCMKSGPVLSQNNAKSQSGRVVTKQFNGRSTKREGLTLNKFGKSLRDNTQEGSLIGETMCSSEWDLEV